jgi:hypothetical protein
MIVLTRTGDGDAEIGAALSAIRGVPVLVVEPD